MARTDTVVLVGQPGDQFKVRFPDGLRGRLKAAAKANKRSVNAEVISTLEAAYPEPVEPESPNEAPRKAAEEVMGGWSDALRAMGADPEQNEALNRLRAKIEEAVNG